MDFLDTPSEPRMPLADQEKIDLTRNNDDSILGGALCGATPVLFTKKLGLITISSNDFGGLDSNMSCSDITTAGETTGYANSFLQDNFSTMTTNQDLEEMYCNTDSVPRLRAAFLSSLRQNKGKCEEILMQLFPAQEEAVMDIDANLDTLVLRVAKDLIDDYPANDPRWTNYRDMTTKLNMVSSLNIAHQLDGKQKALDLYVSFLKEHSLWNRFCAVTHRGTVMSTAHVIAEFAEKIVTASSLYNLRQRYVDVIDAAIAKTLPDEAYVSEELSAQDVFFRQVSTIHSALPNLAQLAVEMTQSERPTPQISQYILKINNVIITVLLDVGKFRHQQAERFAPSRFSEGITEYLPWTAASGNHGLRTCLNIMQNLTIKHGVGGTNDASVQSQLYEQFVKLADVILDGRKSHMESMRGTEKFEILLKQFELDRTNLIQPLLKDEQYESATMLAEKYCDFASLIQVCDRTNNKSRLDSYMAKFASEDFSRFLFSWYLKDGRQGQLVERCQRGDAAELTEKLYEHPDLCWLQTASIGEFRQTAATLRSLALKQVDLMARKKVMLSMTKLALLASDGSAREINEDVQAIDSELALIEYQEDIPVQVLQAYGYDPDKVKVFSPQEIISLYTCDENVDANEFDFRKALDVLNYVETEEEKSSLNGKIWARAARRDSWDVVSENPDEQIRSTLVFKLMDYSYCLDKRPEHILPPLNMILAESELADLAVCSNFQYLLQLVYEYAVHNY